MPLFRHALGRTFHGVRASVPYPQVRVGDVIDDLGQFAVVTRTEMLPSGEAGLLEAVCENGERRETAYPARARMGQVSRVGQGCQPTPQGLHDFLLQHAQEIVSY